MDLEDLKNNWQALDRAAESEDQLLSPQKIRKAMTRKYRSRLHRITFWEIILTLAGLYFAALFIYQFHLFNSIFLQITGGLCIALLLAIPAIRLWSLARFYPLANPSAPPAEVLPTFTTNKIRFFQIQQFNVGLGLLLLTAVIVLSTKVYQEFAVTSSPTFWVVVLLGSTSVVLLFDRLLLKRYRRIIKAAEAFLQEIK